MRIECEYSEMVKLSDLKDHPKNMNDHPSDQIERLAKIIDYQGMRSPIVVSKLSGFITKGHGRKLALEHLGWESAPVDYQDYDNEEQEYADICADNSIASWASLDLSKINAELENLGPMDIDLLGLKDFAVDIAEVDLPDLGDGSDSMIKKVTLTLSTEQADILDDAIRKAKKELDCTDGINDNTNGNAVAAIMRQYVS